MKSRQLHPHTFARTNKLTHTDRATLHKHCRTHTHTENEQRVERGERNVYQEGVRYATNNVPVHKALSTFLEPEAAVDAEEEAADDKFFFPEPWGWRQLEHLLG